MSLPSGPKLEVALLSAIVGAGGNAKADDLYKPLADEFGLSDENRLATHPNGANKWMKRVQFAKLALVLKGDVHRNARGDRVWRITDQGRRRIADQ